MPQSKTNEIAFRTLYRSSIVHVSDYCCHAAAGGPEPEEYSESNHIVLMRRGAFCKHFGRRRVTADVNHAAFFSKGSSYRVSHPAECGDRGTIFAFATPVLRDLVREADPAIDERPDQPFPFATGPCDSAAFWRHRSLVQQLEGGSCDPLGVDVIVLRLISDVLEAAFERHSVPRKRRYKGTDSNHRDRAEAAKSYLASRLGQRIALDDVARAVHVSPFHLDRVFQQQTGVPIHRYLMRLRLRASLERLADGSQDLTSLALELGFSSHSHFSESFRREFGQTPSNVRRDWNRQSIRELSKILKV